MSRMRASAALVVACLAWTAAADAKTFEVTRKNDPAPGQCKRNDCSLREAVLAANERAGKDKIVLLKAKRYKLNQPNPGGVSEDVGDFGDLDVNNDPLAIVHRGTGRATIDANDLDRAMHVQAGATTAFKRIRVTGGLTTGDGGGILSLAPLRFVRSSVAGNVGDDGAGIDVDDSAGISLLRSAVTGNQAVDSAGSNGGGINTAEEGTTVRIVRSVVRGNRARGNGGGIEVGGADLRVNRSTITANRTDSNGGGIHSAGAGTLRIKSSTVSGNQANGGASHGGGLYFDGPTVNISNSTFHGNSASERGGGIHAQDGADLSLNAVTVTRNRAAADYDGILVLVGGGGLSRISSAGFDVRNSLIALNVIGAPGAGNNSDNDCASDTPFDSLGNNLLSTPVAGTNCEGFDGPNDLVRSNPKIGKLRRNGGPTKTVALKKGSAAIGHAHKPSVPNRDQRGRKRDNNPDSGAFERGA